MRLEPRAETPWWLRLLAPVGAVAASLAACALLLAWAEAPVLTAYAMMFDKALGSGFALTETLTRATPLVLTGLAAAVAFRAKLWNIGGEGQLYAGALAATAIGTGWLTLPPLLMVPALLLAGFLAGAALLIGPALLKQRFGVDEVVTTLLLNFIVLLFVSLLLEGPMQDPMSMGWPQAAPIVAEGELPRLAGRTRLHAGLIVALVAALLLAAVMARSTLGYEIRAVGANAAAAGFAGLPVTWVTLKVAMLSGGLAGLAGVGEVAGLKGYLTLDLSPGYGYGGIVVAMLAGLNPLGVIAAAVFIAAVFVGADAMSRSLGVSSYLADVIVATSLLAMLLAGLLTRFRVRRG